MPVNVWGAVFFLVLVAPGLLYDLLLETRIARAEESTFREISRVVLASLTFSALPLIVITVAGDKELTPWLPDPSQWAASGGSYAVRHYGPIVFALALQCLASCGSALAFHHARHGKKPTLRAVPTWQKVFRADNPTERPPVIRVKTTNGTTYEGCLADYSNTFDEDRDLVLSPPLKVKKQGGTMVDMPASWQRLIVPSGVVHSIAVRYQSDGSPGETV